MKRISIFSVLILLILWSCGGTKEAFNQARAGMSTGDEDPIRVEIPYVTKEMVTARWIAMMKNNQAKIYQKDNEIFADNTILNDIKDGTLDVLVIFREREDEVVMTALFDLGGALLSEEQHPEQYKAALEMLEQFRVKTALESLNERKKSAARELKSLENDKTDLEEKNRKLRDEIRDNTEEINKLEKEINSSKRYNDRIDKQIGELQNK